MITTYSQFFYGYQITTSNRYIDFQDSTTPVQAILNIGDYTATTILTEIKRAMDDVGVQAYTVTLNRTTRIITIAATSNFTLLASSGSGIGQGTYSLMGFVATDRSGSNSYSGTLVSGSCYVPQCKLQSYVPSLNNKEKLQATVNESANGEVEVVYFGDKTVVEMNIDWITEKPMPTGYIIKDDRSALTNIRAFMENIVGKNKVEFMADMNSPETFQTLMLESTPESSVGVSFKLKEKHESQMPNIYSTGLLKFRVV